MMNEQWKWLKWHREQLSTVSNMKTSSNSHMIFSFFCCFSFLLNRCQMARARFSNFSHIFTHTLPSEKRSFLWKNLYLIEFRNSPLLMLDSLRNFSFAICFRLAIISAWIDGSSLFNNFCISLTVCVESFEAIDTSELMSKLLSVESFFIFCGKTGVVESMGVFDTFEMVTVVLIDCGCCFSIVFCLFNVAKDITIWSQCDERSFLACKSSHDEFFFQQITEIISITYFL